MCQLSFRLCYLRWYLVYLFMMHKTVYSDIVWMNTLFYIIASNVMKSCQKLYNRYNVANSLLGDMCVYVSIYLQYIIYVWYSWPCFSFAIKKTTKLAAVMCLLQWIRFPTYVCLHPQRILLWNVRNGVLSCSMDHRTGSLMFWAHSLIKS